ncbi:glycosyltransferase family 4 protein [Ahrensia sp. R2A130]|uniref:glycosyltransferase family 4 protein n=1 Tax=Ahrensia sp. R2A130 TaxID=744979 RepID=UPI0001E08C8D|nr:glycosyltransferase family 4 protein [Ahrensia sp. R2A130]EFL89122.1 glycosyl transferase, group 1 [Ahrensia sp. R2A130]
MSRIFLLGSYGESLLNFRGPLIEAMIAAGHDVLAAAPDLDATTRTQLSALGATPVDAPMNRTGTNPIADIATMLRLRKIIRETKPDFVLTYTIKPNIWGGLAARSLGIRSAAMITGLGYAFAEDDAASVKQQAVGALARKLYAAAARHHSKLIFQNPDDMRDFERAGCLDNPAKVVFTAGSGVDVAKLLPSPFPQKPLFLMVARLLVAKGVREYAEAAAQVKRDHPDWEFRLVGWRDEGPDAVPAAEIKSWAVQGLDYRGPSNDVAGELAEASIYVLPSYREGTPRSVLEAMACGRPVITTNAPGCRETLRDGETGFLVPVRDVDTLANRMRDLGADSDLRARMGAAGRAFAEERFDVTKVNEKLLHDLGLA